MNFIVKSLKKSLRRALCTSILTVLSANSFADLTNNSSASTGQAQISWSTNDAKELLAEDNTAEVTPPGSTQVLTSSPYYSNKCTCCTSSASG